MGREEIDEWGARVVDEDEAEATGGGVRGGAVGTGSHRYPDSGF